MLKDEIARLQSLKNGLEGTIYRLRKERISQEWDTITAQARDIVRGRRKISAIKLIREYWGYNLKQSKELADSIWEEGSSTAEDLEQDLAALLEAVAGTFIPRDMGVPVE